MCKITPCSETRVNLTATTNKKTKVRGKQFSRTSDTREYIKKAKSIV